MKNFMQSSLFVTLGSLLGCASDTYHKTVDYVDRDRFMVDWHVIAGRFTMFENEPYNSIEGYTWNEKEQQIDINFRYNKGSFDGELKKIPQTAWIENKKTNAHWKVKPAWFPFKMDYLVIGLDPNYEWTAIGVPSQKYLWIMSPNPFFPKEKVPAILEQLAKTGYNIKDIIYVPQNGKK